MTESTGEYGHWDNLMTAKEVEEQVRDAVLKAASIVSEWNKANPDNPTKCMIGGLTIE